MKLSVVLLSLYIFFLASSLFTIVFGITGVASHKRLMDRTDVLLRNMEDLQNKKIELTRKIRSLRSDPLSLEIEARRIGLYKPGTDVLLLHDMEYSQPLPESGRVMFADNSRGDNRNFFRVLSMMFAVVVFLAGLITRKMSRDTAKESR